MNLYGRILKFLPSNMTKRIDTGSPDVAICSSAARPLYILRNRGHERSFSPMFGTLRFDEISMLLVCQNLDILVLISQSLLPITEQQGRKPSHQDIVKS